MSDTHALPRWVLGLAASAMVLFLGFVGTSIIGYGERMTRMEEQLKVAAEGRYRRSDADADFRLRDIQIEALSIRLERLDNERRWQRRREGRPE